MVGLMIIFQVFDHFLFIFIFHFAIALSYSQAFHRYSWTSITLSGGVYVAVLVAVLDSLGFGLDSMYIQNIAYTSTTISSVAHTKCEEGRRLGCVVCHRDHWVSVAMPDGPLSIIVHDVAIVGYDFQHLTIPDISVKCQQIIQGLLGGMIAL